MIDYAWVVYHLRYCQYRSPSGASVKGGGEAGVTGKCLFLYCLFLNILWAVPGLPMLYKMMIISREGGGALLFLTGLFEYKIEGNGSFLRLK